MMNDCTSDRCSLCSAEMPYNVLQKIRRSVYARAYARASIRSGKVPEKQVFTLFDFEGIFTPNLYLSVSAENYRDDASKEAL